MGKTTVPLIPSTVTTKVLLVASTAKLLAKLMVGVVPMATAGVEEIPRVASVDFVTEVSEKPKRALAVSDEFSISILDWSPVVPDFIVKTLFTESYSTSIPKRCSTAARSLTPLGMALSPLKPLSLRVTGVTGKPSISFLAVLPGKLPALTERRLVPSTNLKPCVA